LSVLFIVGIIFSFLFSLIVTIGFKLIANIYLVLHKTPFCLLIMGKQKLWNVLAVNGIKTDLWLTADKEVLPLHSQKMAGIIQSPQGNKKKFSKLARLMIYHQHRKNHPVNGWFSLRRSSDACWLF